MVDVYNIRRPRFPVARAAIPSAVGELPAGADSTPWLPVQRDGCRTTLVRAKAKPPRGIAVNPLELWRVQPVVDLPILCLRILVWLRRVCAGAGPGLPLTLPARARRGCGVKGGLAGRRCRGGRAGRRRGDRGSGP